MKVTFYRSRDAFPHLRQQQRDDDIMVSVRNGDSSLYEFSIVHVGTDSRSRSPIALQVRLFADSWRAFTDLPEFFSLLASLDESGRNGRSSLDLDVLTPLLVDLGWVDRTEHYGSQHEHALGCLICGSREVDR